MPNQPEIQISNEDNLRINVLLAQKPQVIRINESNMMLYSLTARGEISIQLHPTVKDEQYLRWVRELLAMKVTGSPGGYPVFIKRWTRMGHTQNTLEHMLLLGEPEAIIAAAYTKDLSHEIAERIWWANPSTEIARQLLKHSDIVNGTLGIELAKFLMEFLPFEERQLDVVDTVRLCLQGDLMTQKQRTALWKRAKRKNPYYIGFIYSSDLIPETCTATLCHANLSKKLVTLIAANNPYAETLVNLQSEQGQKWLITFKYALYKPVDPEVVVSLFIAVNTFFQLPWTEFKGVRDISHALRRASDYCSVSTQTSASDIPEELSSLLILLNEYERQLLEACLVLSQLGEDTLIPIFSGNDSVGSVMRKRMLPVTTPILERIDILM